MDTKCICREIPIAALAVTRIPGPPRTRCFSIRMQSDGVAIMLQAVLSLQVGNDVLLHFQERNLSTFLGGNLIVTIHEGDEVRVMLD